VSYITQATASDAVLRCCSGGDREVLLNMVDVICNRQRSHSGYRVWPLVALLRPKIIFCSWGRTSSIKAKSAKAQPTKPQFSSWIWIAVASVQRHRTLKKLSHHQERVLVIAWFNKLALLCNARRGRFWRFWQHDHERGRGSIYSLNFMLVTRSLSSVWSEITIESRGSLGYQASRVTAKAAGRR